MNPILEQVLRVNLIWSLALVAVSAAMAALRVRSPRTRYHVMWAAYTLVLPATIVSLFYRRDIVVPAEPLSTVGGAGVVSSPDATAIATAGLIALMAAGTIHFLWRWISLTVRTRRLTPCVDPRVGTVVEQLKSDLGVRTGVQCYETKVTSSPCSLGLRRPAIVIARNVIARASRVTLVHIIAHELAHIRSHDYARNLIQKLVRSLFAFNPIAHLYNAWLDDAREVACDRDVIEAAGVDRRAYSQTLLEMGLRLQEQWAGSPSLAFLRHRSNLMKRISCMRTTHTRDRAIKAVILGTLVTIVFVIIACSNTEEVNAPAAGNADASSVAALPDAATLLHEGEAVFFDDAGGKHLVEVVEGSNWTSEELQDKLHELMLKHTDDPTVITDKDVAEMKYFAQKLHEGDDVSFGDSGAPRGVFIDENGNRAVIEFQGQWVSKEKLQELHEEKADDGK